MNLQDFLFGYAINTVLQVISYSIKNPASKAKYKSALRKVVVAVLGVYPDLLSDPAVTSLAKQ